MSYNRESELNELYQTGPLLTDLLYMNELHVCSVVHQYIFSRNLLSCPRVKFNVRTSWIMIMVPLMQPISRSKELQKGKTWRINSKALWSPAPHHISNVSSSSRFGTFCLFNSKNAPQSGDPTTSQYPFNLIILRMKLTCSHSTCLIWRLWSMCLRMILLIRRKLKGNMYPSTIW